MLAFIFKLVTYFIIPASIFKPWLVSPSFNYYVPIVITIEEEQASNTLNSLKVRQLVFVPLIGQGW